jgi:hypothetical protein
VSVHTWVARANAVRIYNITISPARFQTKNNFQRTTMPAL